MRCMLSRIEARRFWMALGISGVQTINGSYHDCVRSLALHCGTESQDGNMWLIC